jgi:hypothetical protein
LRLDSSLCAVREGCSVYQPSTTSSRSSCRRLPHATAGGSPGTKSATATVSAADSHLGHPLGADYPTRAQCGSVRDHPLRPARIARYAAVENRTTTGTPREEDRRDENRGRKRNGSCRAVHRVRYTTSTLRLSRHGLGGDSRTLAQPSACPGGECQSLDLISARPLRTHSGRSVLRPYSTSNHGPSRW